jgi:tetratricopeptide (TPR) repeat protein
MRPFVTLAALALFLAHPLASQQPKSQGEVNVLMAMQNAQTADERIAAAQKLLTEFKDTEFKEFANYVLMLAYQQKNDFENMLLYGERTLSINPDNAGTPDDQWLMAKKDFMSSAYESLGLVAMKRKTYPVAEENFRKSLEVSAEQTAAGFFYLGQSLKEQGKKDEAVGALDQAIARGDFKLGDGRPAAATLKADIQNAK